VAGLMGIHGRWRFTRPEPPGEDPPGEGPPD